MPESAPTVADLSAATLLEGEASVYYDAAVSAAKLHDYAEAGRLLARHADRLARAHRLYPTDRPRSHA